MVTEPLGVVRVARQVLITIVVNAALQFLASFVLPRTTINGHACLDGNYQNMV